MSKNISIQEGGQGKAFGRVQKLKIAQSGGGETLWVPEDDVKTKSLYVSKNGTYLASSENVYGYDEVDVNITNGVTYTDDDVDYYIGVDDDGYLEEPEAMPSYIEITTPPDKTSYIVGEPINTAGMVVTAYYGDGTEYGVIPRDEITLDPIIAVDGGEESATSDLNTNGLDKPFAITEASSCAEGLWSWTFEKKCRFTSGLTAKKSSSNQFQGFWVAASETPFSVTSYLNGRYDDTREALTTTISGKTVYYSYTQGSFSEDLSPNLNDLGEYRALNLRHDNIAWTMVYGTITGGSKVDVKWERQDGEELTTTFDITVNPIGNITSPDSGGGGSSGGSW